MHSLTMHLLQKSGLHPQCATKQAPIGRDCDGVIADVVAQVQRVVGRA